MSRNILGIAALVFALALAWSTNATAENELLPAELAGKFTTASGVSWVLAAGDQGAVEGFFSGKDRFGQVTGQYERGAVHAYWFDDSATPVCSAERDGTRNWGRITFTVEPSGLRGFIGECDDVPTLPWSAR